MSKNLYKTAILLVFSFFIISGCQLISGVDKASEYVTGKVHIEQKKQVDKTLATIKCQELCQLQLATSDLDFSKGPCLDETIIPDWACDIAHSPRQEVDDDPANQCGSFRTGETHHFVELDGNCNTIQIY